MFTADGSIKTPQAEAGEDIHNFDNGCNKDLEQWVDYAK